MINRRKIQGIGVNYGRACIGGGLQDNYILNDSIKNNLIYGHDNISRDKMVQAAKIAHAHDYIERQPDQYETIIGEHGKFISGGQKQLLAIARAIISDPEILILDEATSFIDVDQEMAVLQKIKATRKDKITLIISHRPSAMRVTDKIITLDNGRIITL